MAAMNDIGQNGLANLTLQAFTEWLQKSGGKLPHPSHQPVVNICADFFNKHGQMLVVWVGGRWVDPMVSSESRATKCPIWETSD